MTTNAAAKRHIIISQSARVRHPSIAWAALLRQVSQGGNRHVRRWGRGVVCHLTLKADWRRMGFQAHFSCWQNSLPRGYMTKSPGVLLARSWGCPQILEPVTVPSTVACSSPGCFLLQGQEKSLSFSLSCVMMENWIMKCNHVSDIPSLPPYSIGWNQGTDPKGSQWGGIAPRGNTSWGRPRGSSKTSASHSNE